MGSAVIELDQFGDFREKDRITIRVKVIKIHDPQMVGGGKTKQDVIVADLSRKATVTLWEQDVGLLQLHQSYQLNRLEIRIYQGKIQLSFPSTPSIDIFDNIDPPTEIVTSLEDEIDEHFDGVKVTGMKGLETVYVCNTCTRNIQPSANFDIAECSACKASQICSTSKQTARLTIENTSNKLILRAYDESLKLKPTNLILRFLLMIYCMRHHSIVHITTSAL